MLLPSSKEQPRCCSQLSAKLLRRDHWPPPFRHAAACGAAAAPRRDLQHSVEVGVQRSEGRAIVVQVQQRPQLPADGHFAHLEVVRVHAVVSEAVVVVVRHLRARAN